MVDIDIIDSNTLIRTNDQEDNDPRREFGVQDEDKRDYVEIKGNGSTREIAVTAVNDDHANVAVDDIDGSNGMKLTFTSGGGQAGGINTANDPNGGNGGDIEFALGTGGAAGFGGSGVAGAPGRLKMSSGLINGAPAQTLDLAAAEGVLTLVPGTPVGTTVVSNVLFIDPGGATVDLLLPPEADANGLILHIANTADAAEDLVVKDDGDATTIITISQNEVGIVFCDGITWRGGIMATT